MRVLAVVHQDDAGPGVFAPPARERADLETWRPDRGEEPPPEDPDAAMVFGGAMDAHQEATHPWLVSEKRWLAGLLGRGVPVLGVCLGAQLVAEAAGGSVRRAAAPEIGWREVWLTREAELDPVLGRMPERFMSLQWHSYEAVPPDAARELARSEGTLQGFRVGESAWGIQFHAEVDARTVESWIARYAKDRDAVSAGVEPERLRADTASLIAGWNRLGRALARRFLDTALSRP